MSKVYWRLSIAVTVWPLVHVISSKLLSPGLGGMIDPASSAGCSPTLLVLLISERYLTAGLSQSLPTGFTEFSTDDQTADADPCLGITLGTGH